MLDANNVKIYPYKQEYTESDTLYIDGNAYTGIKATISGIKIESNGQLFIFGKMLTSSKDILWSKYIQNEVLLKNVYCQGSWYGWYSDITNSDVSANRCNIKVAVVNVSVTAGSTTTGSATFDIPDLRDTEYAQPIGISVINAHATNRVISVNLVGGTESATKGHIIMYNQGGSEFTFNAAVQIVYRKYGFD
jgi:hypothetical protein